MLNLLVVAWSLYPIWFTESWPRKIEKWSKSGPPAER